VLLPRQDVIVRQISLAGVSNRDLAAAVALQMDTMHPYGEDDVQYGWAALGSGAVLVGSAARHHGALRRGVQRGRNCRGVLHVFRGRGARGHPPDCAPAAGFVALTPTEIYGESQARPVFSAELDRAPERAVELALAELRLDPDTLPVTLDMVLPAPRVNPIENDLRARPASLRDRAGRRVSLADAHAERMPPERRSMTSRIRYVPTMVLASLLLLAVGALRRVSEDGRRPVLAEARGRDREARAAGGARAGARPADRYDAWTLPAAGMIFATAGAAIWTR